jgi:hypothetical protein
LHWSEEKYTKVFLDVIARHCLTQSPGVRWFFCYSGVAVNLCINTCTYICTFWIRILYLNLFSTCNVANPGINNYHLRMVSTPPIKNHEFGEGVWHWVNTTINNVYRRRNNTTLAQIGRLQEGHHIGVEPRQAVGIS